MSRIIEGVTIVDNVVRSGIGQVGAMVKHTVALTVNEAAEQDIAECE